jgi:hypothetical protein
MAKDADGNAYYDAGTIVEQFDDWEVYEDADGNVGFYKASADAELRLHEAGHVFGDQRPAPGTDELADGEQMLYVSDGTNATAGDLILASSDGTDVTLATVSTTAV